MAGLLIDDILPLLLDTVRSHPNTVLAAPPGSGKTTRVPLALLDIFTPGQGKIILLEPRRIAAVAAARYMAQLLGEPVGRTVGYTIRFESKVSDSTRIEVVTEGVLTRRIQSDPELPGVACVIFDEFHERSLQGDLGLALCLEAQQSLRPALKLLVMSATLESEPVARILGDAPVVVAQGRRFTVELRYLDTPDRRPLPQRMAAAIRTALAAEQGDLLAFLPGSGEIRAVARELDELSGVVICPLYGDLPFEQQQRAILPGPVRRVVLATAIAETSLTIEGVRVVVDAGLARRLQLDPSTGLERLVTVRASRAQAEQRAGRAGRTAPGVCYRLYSRQTFAAMTPFSPPEIVTADLAPLLLELAAWGVRDPAALVWLDLPPGAHLAAAQELLQQLGALDGQGMITPLGRRMAMLPLHPRLARLLLDAQAQGQVAAACRLVAGLSGRTAQQSVIEQTARQLTQLMGERFFVSGSDGTALLDAHPYLAVAAWPDRIAMQRPDSSGRYLLASGRGALLSPRAGCSGARFLVALQVDGGQGADGVIHQGVALTLEQLRGAAAHLISRQRKVFWDAAADRVCAAEQELIGVLVLAARQVPADDAEAMPLLLEQVRQRGLELLAWNPQARQLQARAVMAASLIPEEDWPDLSDAALLASLERWMGPHLAAVRSLQGLQQLPMLQLLQEILGWNVLQKLESSAPAALTIPSGRTVVLDYSDQEGPVLAAKLQELFGLACSPTVCRGRRAVLVHLLSPAGRPVAVTRDLEGFWGRGYLDVRKELRGRYPKHPWPEDPRHAVATHKTKNALEKV